MSTGKQKRASPRGNNISPSSSPPLPPPPTMAHNRGSATPKHFTTMPASVSSSSSTKTLRPQAPPPALANGSQLARASVPSPRRKTSSMRRWMARVLLVYLGYTFLFVCPNLPDSKTDMVCDGIVRAQDWLKPYSDPVVEKLDYTYRTYGEPVVDQYGRPLYERGQKYYVDYAQPALKKASVKVKDSYQQYAHPHVSHAMDVLYTDNVKAHVNRAQTHFHLYQKQAQDKLQYAQKVSKDANDHVWRLHATHIHPVVEKVSPHAKVAWNKAAIGAGTAYAGASTIYNKHVNPYAQQSLAVVLDAFDHAKNVFAEHTDELFGTHLSAKSRQPTARAAKRARQAKDAAAKKLHQAKADADNRAEGIKGTLLKKATDAQKLAEEYTDSIKTAVMGKAGEAKKAAENPIKTSKIEEIKAAAVEKGQQAQKLAEEFVENVSEAVAKKAHDAQHLVSEEVEYIKKMADEKTQEAGKVSEQIKDAVLEKARLAQEAVARQAENVRLTAQEQAAKIQNAGASLKDSVVGTTHDAREAIGKQSDELLKAASDKKAHLEKIAAMEANAIHHAAVQKEKEVEKAVKDATRKAHDAYDSLGHEAKVVKEKVIKVSKDADQTVRQNVGEAYQAAEHKAEDLRKKVVTAGKEADANMRQNVEDARKVVESESKKLRHKVEEAGETVRKSAQETHEAAEHKAEDLKERVTKAGSEADKAVRQHAQEAQEAVQGQVVKIQKATEQIAHEGSAQIREQVHSAQKAKEEVSSKVGEKVKEAGEKLEQVGDAAKLKAHDAHAASKASLAAMLKGIETSFGQFYNYEETESKNLWDKLQAAIDEHIAGAKKSAHDLEQANKNAYESFEAYVKSWSDEAGDMEERLSKLGKQSVDSIKKIGLQTESSQGNAKSKAQILSNNVEVYVSGLRDFLLDRLAASKETVMSELHVFTDTSSEEQEQSARGKLAAMEESARSRLESAGQEARGRANELMKQVDEVWSQSEAKSRDYVQKTRDLAAKASEDAKAALTGAGARVVEDGPGGLAQKVFKAGAPADQKTRSVSEEARESSKGAADKVREVLRGHGSKDSEEGSHAQVEDNGPNVRVAMEEPGSGHRHHHH